MGGGRDGQPRRRTRPLRGRHFASRVPAGERGRARNGHPGRLRAGRHGAGGGLRSSASPPAARSARLDQGRRRPDDGPGDRGLRAGGRADRRVQDRQRAAEHQSVGAGHRRPRHDRDARVRQHAPPPVRDHPTGEQRGREPAVGRREPGVAAGGLRNGRPEHLDDGSDPDREPGHLGPGTFPVRPRGQLHLRAGGLDQPDRSGRHDGCRHLTELALARAYGRHDRGADGLRRPRAVRLLGRPRRHPGLRVPRGDRRLDEGSRTAARAVVQLRRPAGDLGPQRRSAGAAGGSPATSAR